MTSRRTCQGKGGSAPVPQQLHQVSSYLNGEWHLALESVPVAPLGMEYWPVVDSERTADGDLLILIQNKLRYRLGTAQNPFPPQD